MLDKGLSLIIEKLNPVLVYVFGSFARGELWEDSDIDLAFLSDGEFTSYEIFMLAQEIAEIYNREVDLIDLKKASTVFVRCFLNASEKIQVRFYECFGFSEAIKSKNKILNLSQ